ncbi:MAG: hypothetical protein PWP76_286 [Candidatus Diapherotrites archaeon]|nr:hypothetical protein [Candidatus Diapherotrites archaeon]MDN5366755.1 hypothetical protein [Candidatus Diapherotrites archaeon]
MRKRAREIIAYAAVAALIIIIVAGAWVYAKNPEIFDEFVRKYGYLGVFLAVFVTNVSLFIGIPTPTYIFLAVAMGLHPVAVTLVAAFASALGESTGYLLGVGSRKAIERKYGHILQQWKYNFHKHAFLTITVIAALPFPPDDLAGIIAGSLGYDYKKFLAATFLGKTIKYGATAVLTVTGIKIINTVFYD